MDRLIAAYIAYARGEGTEQYAPADLAELVEEAAAKARRDGAQVALDIPEDPLVLPLRADARRRCLGNLLDNARKHARRIAIGLTSEPRGETGAWAMVTVDDDGPGLPAEQREEAFRPFATFSAGGTGLGLAIARDIARAHGGDIVLEDSPLGGLRARVRLPV
jgi:two-component system osmolarity sensor histidine kinase EnvZ